MQLIYRSQTVEFKRNSVLLQKKLYAVNWRFQVSGMTFNTNPVFTQNNHQSHVVNWRFRLATQG